MPKSSYFYYDLEGNYASVTGYFKTIVASLQKTLKNLPEGTQFINQFILVEGEPLTEKPYINLHTYDRKVYRIYANEVVCS